MTESQAQIEQEKAGEGAGAGIEQASVTYVGRWNRLVSTTNWEKGRIIFEWREELTAANSPASQYSDEAWSRRVGGVSGQHAGRLRRVYQRFGQVYEQYSGLYWSHFQACVDWEDAEMWLEGAVQSQWSVSQMRRQRSETLGTIPAQQPGDDEVVSGELDEDFEPALDQPPELTGDYAEVQTPEATAPQHAEEDQEPDEALHEQTHGASIYSDDDQRETIQFVRPFENLAELPEDLAEAFEAFKLAILRHKTQNWQEIPLDDVLSCLDALKALVAAPSLEDAPL